MTSVENIPSFVSCTDAATSTKVLEIYEQWFTLTSLNGVEFPLPKDMKILAINDGFIHSKENFQSLGSLIDEFVSEGVFFFFPLAKFNNVFKAKFSFDVMDWIETEVFESPVIFLVPDTQLSIIIDEQLSISVIAFKSSLKGKVQEKLGGQEIMRGKFESSLRDNYVGSGGVEKRWLEMFSDKYCDW